MTHDPMRPWRPRPLAHHRTQPYYERPARHNFPWRRSKPESARVLRLRRPLREEENGSVLDVFDDETHEVRIKIDGGFVRYKSSMGASGKILLRPWCTKKLQTILSLYFRWLQCDVDCLRHDEVEKHTRWWEAIDAENMKNAGVIPQAIQNMLDTFRLTTNTNLLWPWAICKYT